MYEPDEVELKERERICNLDRVDLVREYVDALNHQELVTHVFEYIDMCEEDFSSDELRHQLLSWI